MKLHRLLSSSLLLLALAVAGCSPQDTAAPAVPVSHDVALETTAAQARGFTVGAVMNASPVYVFFDTQCRHCGNLWNAAIPLHTKVKFVWIPVGLMNASSTAQGAALLSAADPKALMTEHETSLLAGKGGIAASASPAADIASAIKTNTALLKKFGAAGVPFLVARHGKTGQAVSRDGSMSTAALAEFLGVDAP